MPFLSSRVIRGAFLGAPQNLELRTIGSHDDTPAPEQPDAGEIDLREKARQEAAAILAEAQKEAGDIKEKARQDGYRQGRQEAAREMEAQRRAVQEQARDLLRAAEEKRREILRGLEEEIVDLIVETAEKLVMQQLSRDPQAVRAVVQEAIALVRDRAQVYVYAHPEDVPVLEESRDELLAALRPNAVLHIVPDKGLRRGGCLVDTPQGMVDATLDTRLEAIRKALGGR
ncbi:MAG: flagellar biosynthesis protein [Peptococcaceae bacterium]|nr:flagellar biosynthesis protein [Peptococcaceae bacterium]